MIIRRAPYRRSDILSFGISPLRDFIEQKYRSVPDLDQHWRSLASIHFYIWRSALDEVQHVQPKFRGTLYELADKYGISRDWVRSLDELIAEELLHMIVLRYRNAPKALVYYTFSIAKCLKEMD